MADREGQIDTPPSGDIARVAEHLFRHEAGKLVSVITGIFGIHRLQLAEDVVQEALVRALQTWPFYGVPKNPAAWITQTAKNLALDIIRREKLFHEKQPAITISVEESATPAATGAAMFDDEIRDDRLRLMFACCHPLIPQESQTALALKTLCGFGPAEIARAFLTSEAAIAKRLTRARQRITELRILFEIPSGADLSVRLEGVLQTLYLLFNEGYKASSGEKLLKEELCHEALRLAVLLTEHQASNQPRVHALAALMFLNAARLPARLDTEGNILQLKDQDRSKWDEQMIQSGIWHLGQSAVGTELSEYHLQAGIAACHSMAQDYASTDWPQILALYDRLIRIDDSPVVALNRAVALAQVHGAEAGLQAVQSMQNREYLEDYHLLHAVLAEFKTQINDLPGAAEHLRKALQLTEIKSELSLLSQRLRDCEERLQGVAE